MFLGFVVGVDDEVLDSLVVIFDTDNLHNFRIVYRSFRVNMFSVIINFKINNRFLIGVNVVEDKKIILVQIYFLFHSFRIDHCNITIHLQDRSRLVFYNLVRVDFVSVNHHSDGNKVQAVMNVSYVKDFLVFVSKEIEIEIVQDFRMVIVHLRSIDVNDTNYRCIFQDVNDLYNVNDVWVRNSDYYYIRSIDKIIARKPTLLVIDHVLVVFYFYINLNVLNYFERTISFEICAAGVIVLVMDIFKVRYLSNFVIDNIHVGVIRYFNDIFVHLDSEINVTEVYRFKIYTVFFRNVDSRIDILGKINIHYVAGVNSEVKGFFGGIKTKPKSYSFSLYFHSNFNKNIQYFLFKQCFSFFIFLMEN